MHDVHVWATWYLLLVTIPLFVIGSLIREKLAHRRSSRRIRPR